MSIFLTMQSCFQWRKMAYLTKPWLMLFYRYPIVAGTHHTVLQQQQQVKRVVVPVCAKRLDPVPAWIQHGSSMLVMLLLDY